MSNLPKLVKKTLADVLLQEGIVAPNHLTDAQQRQKTSGEPLSAVLTKMGVLSEVDLARALCKQYNLPYIDASRYSVPKDVSGLFTADDMIKHKFAPIDKIGKVLLIALGDVPGADFIEMLEKRTGSTVFVYVTTVSQLTNAVKKHFANGQK